MDCLKLIHEYNLSDYKFVLSKKVGHITNNTFKLRRTFKFPLFYNMFMQSYQVLYFLFKLRTAKISMRYIVM